MVAQIKPTEKVNIKETLHDLDLELVLLLDYLQGEDEGDRAVADEMFEQYLPRLEEKLDSYVFAIQNLQAKLEYHQRVADSLARTIKSENRAIAWLKSKLQDFMQLRVERLGVRGKSLEGKITKVTLCMNGGVLPLWHDPDLDVEDFPEEAIDYVPTLNKTRLRSLVEQSGGKLVVGGRAIARIDPRGSHIRF